MILIYIGEEEYWDDKGRFILQPNDKVELEEEEAKRLLETKRFKKDKGGKK